GTTDIGISVSRVSSGEFVVLLTDMQNEESATWIIQRMFTAMNEPLQIESTDILLDVRIGVSMYPNDGDDPELLLANAGAALREAKAALGRDVCLYFSQEMNQRSQAQLRMEGQLHRAVKRGELFLEYQPVIDMSTGRISSFEALIRWRHPELGLVTPDNFIPIAENTGLIEAIGWWVLETACRQLNAWQASGHEHLSIAINVSAVQLRNAELADHIIGIVEQTGIIPGSLTIEITESALIHHIDTAVLIITRLSSAGVRVSLDDFGTGYSSLSYLKRFSIDIVKIDRSFLQDFPSHAHDTAIISAIIAMAHSLGLHVIAEGVETEEQLKVLQSLKCDECQGYLFSKPISREQATLLLSNPTNIRRKVWAAGSHEKLVNNSALSGVLNNIVVAAEQHVARVDAHQPEQLRAAGDKNQAFLTK
ncbi:MAG: putative bifunctional diguanylate cyclase/phosphodiesterase, partial [Shewanella sp.]